MSTKTWTEATFEHMNYPSNTIYYSDELILKPEKELIFLILLHPLLQSCTFAFQLSSLIPIFLSQSSLFALFLPHILKQIILHHHPQNAKSTRIFISE